jgi:hypothetical protein
VKEQEQAIRSTPRYRDVSAGFREASALKSFVHQLSVNSGNGDSLTPPKLHEVDRLHRGLSDDLVGGDGVVQRARWHRLTSTAGWPDAAPDSDFPMMSPVGIIVGRRTSTADCGVTLDSRSVEVRIVVEDDPAIPVYEIPFGFAGRGGMPTGDLLRDDGLHERVLRLDAECMVDRSLSLRG